MIAHGGDDGGRTGTTGRHLACCGSGVVSGVVVRGRTGDRGGAGLEVGPPFRPEPLPVLPVFLLPTVGLVGGEVVPAADDLPLDAHSTAPVVHGRQRVAGPLPDGLGKQRKGRPVRAGRSVFRRVVMVVLRR